MRFGFNVKNDPMLQGMDQNQLPDGQNQVRQRLESLAFILRLFRPEGQST